MSKKNKNFDVKVFANIENVKKCHDNASRLFKDSLNTSKPTGAALIEIGIEELAKGLILLINTPKSDMQNSIKLYDSIFSQFEDTKILGNINDSLKSYDIRRFNTYDHREKLKAIQIVLKSIDPLYQILKPILGNLIPSFNKNFSSISKLFEGVNFDFPPALIENFKSIDVENWDKIKESGLYVNFYDEAVQAPCTSEFDVKHLIMIFIIFYGILNFLIRLNEGSKLDELLLDQKTIFGFFYEIIFPEKKNDSEGAEE
ncbi:MAG: hypothetical protein AMDU4_FER2C00030G0012 [Ferroplasma sp. Type II]|uniref:hypothetical protein n=1 Tax=Ferroplasma sp. Type II TaxID=261388 RepID=UPI000389455B|nr:hypothetical protein [Ferroplasma sp. Type II]EQB74089.1 MAG: hypothetical protein AMDU4_FER2C00030G0012 [Ferroplasma sp. Type II]